MSNTTIYAVDSGSGKLVINTIDSDKISAMPKGLKTFANFNLNDKSYVVGFDPSAKKAYTFQSQNEKTGEFLNQVSSCDISFGTTNVETFYLAGRPMLLTYDPSSEYAQFIEISDTLELISIYSAKIGKGLSTTKPFAYRFGIFFVAYDIENGSVNKYQLSVPANQKLYATKTWSDKWAQGWTRFSFFQLGGENFFIKTNIKYDKVNIDHFMDDPDESSHPVANIPAPPQMQGLQDVAAFTNKIGNAFFATYRDNGEVTFNSIHGNCLGWTDEVQEKAAAGATTILPFTVGTDNYVLVY
ncbi:hypothetical protein [Aquimarina sp. 2201CG5-10]|uniref:hypothetical protein n=1 Tax=Aquimarina callyspongiae TaxID=3098150 RepID=UPI002AB36138|nr:hypothetical protein [Aquimarina sp. 2201CG5-10]MDY8138715.1 hypothetical protein [Aquimarina sp. 2201CG5-10]